MIKHRIGSSGDADAVARLADGDVLTIDKIHPIASLNCRGSAAIAGQIPPLLQLVDTAAVCTECVCLLTQLYAMTGQSRGLITDVQTVLCNRIALRCLNSIGSVQLCPCYRIF